MAVHGITEDDEEVILQKASEIFRRRRIQLELSPNPGHTDSIQINSTSSAIRPYEDLLERINQPSSLASSQQLWTSAYDIGTPDLSDTDASTASYNSTGIALDIGTIPITSNKPLDSEHSLINQQHMSQYTTNIPGTLYQVFSTANCRNDETISDVLASTALPDSGTPLDSRDLSLLNDWDFGTSDDSVDLNPVFFSLTNDPIDGEKRPFQGDNAVALTSSSAYTLQTNDNTTSGTLDQAEVDVALCRPSTCPTSPQEQSFFYPLQLPNCVQPSLHTSNVTNLQIYSLQNGVIETESLPKGGKKRKRVAHTQLENKLGKKYLACLRCRELKEKCVPNPEDPGGCCLRCMDLSLKRKHRDLCYRIIMSSAELIDHSGRPRPCWTLRWATMKPVNLRDWVSKEPRTISITQDIGGTFYDLRVKKFRPRDGDATARFWKTNDVEQRFECTPYAIANMNEAGKILSKYVDSTLLHGMQYYIGRRDSLLTCTYAMAYKYSKDPMASENERDLLQNVLRLWNASRMESRSDRICSRETLGMQPREYEPSCANSGKILLPPVMGAQIEILMTALILQPAKQRVLQLLKELMKEARPQSWFTVYLAMFILLHSCALLTESDRKKAEKQGLLFQFLRPSLVRELHEGAEIILAYFRWFNEKMSHPFTMDWSSPCEVTRMGFNEEQSQFIKNTIVVVKHKATLFKKIHDDGAVENEFYFVSRLFDPELTQTHNAN